MWMGIHRHCGHHYSLVFKVKDYEEAMNILKNEFPRVTKWSITFNTKKQPYDADFEADWIDWIGKEDFYGV